MFDLTEKVAFVAGGAGYLALPVCMGLAEQGARVVIGDVDRERLDEAVAGVAGVCSAENVMGVHFDVADETAIKEAIAGTLEQFGRLDVMVNATAAAVFGSLEELTADQFEGANRVNLTGAFLLARESAEAMCGGGSIVMYASMYGLIAPDPSMYEPPLVPNPIEYNAGKAAICQMTRYLAAHYGRRNIRVNAIAPGPFPWDSLQKQEPEFIERLKTKTMLGRIGSRHETAGAVVFLASDESSYVTGQVLSVDGGWTAW